MLAKDKLEMHRFGLTCEEVEGAALDKQEWHWSMALCDQMNVN